MREASSILMLTALLALGAARADTLIMEGLEQAKNTATERPTRGMTMDAVAARWGTPKVKDAPVGQPPITRWEYGGFVVFFEYNHVIHSVMAHQ